MARNANAPDKIGTGPVYFDDRKTIVVSSSIVNFPTSLPRFYGDGESGIVARQDLFSGDFEVTGSTVLALADQFVGRGFTEYVKPFNENKRYENTPAATKDAFFTTGSSVDLFGVGLQQPLKTKTQIHLVLPINNKVMMLPLSSTMYYYNRDNGAWQVPSNSSYVTDDDGSIPAGTSTGDITDPNMYGVLNNTIEDARGFGPIGNRIMSGSGINDGVGDAGQPTDSVFLATPNHDVTFGEVLSKQYKKTTLVNQSYEAQHNETFELPISQPFLIEKAVIELPIAAGNGWFKNRTTSYIPITWTTDLLDVRFSTGFDFAGPALTVALYNQIQVGDLTRRDLIMTGTITHALDNVAEVVLSHDPPFTQHFQARAIGFKAYANPGSVITPVLTSQGYCFTGSVVLQLEAAVTHGITFKWTLSDSNSTNEQFKQQMRDMFASPTIHVSNAQRYQVSAEYATIAYINPFGRSASGFNASGRSVLGQEFVSPGTAGAIPNPLYIKGSDPTKTGDDSMLPSEIETAIASLTGPEFFGGGIRAFAQTAAFLGGSRQSPYLVKPGDKLILSVSKTRPFFYGIPIITLSTTSGSYVDDITLNTGSVNMTLYGCTLQENQELNDTLNQSLASDAIHEMVGAEPVVDQFEVSFRDEYVGGMFDDYVTGSLVNRTTGPDGRMMLRTNNSPRGRIFSGFNAFNTPMTEYEDIAFDPPTLTGNQENITNPSKNFRLQPWFEKVGTPRVLKMTSPSERMWDSMMPSFVDCMTADGCGIGIGPSPSVEVEGDASNPIPIEHRSSEFFGTIFFDSTVGGAVPTAADLTLPITNMNWTKAFPFEPRYSRAPRFLDVSTSFLATYFVESAGGSITIEQIPATPIDGGVLIGIPGMGGLDQLYPGIENTTFLVDANLSSKNGNYDFVSFNTCSLGIDDQLRQLYGFGDRRRPPPTVSGPFDSGVQPFLFENGSDHYAEWRDAGEFPGLRFSLQLTWVKVAFGVVIRGWKYGVMNGLPMFNSGYWRQGHYGQFRDMLEQRPFTKFYNVPDPSVSGLSSIAGQTTSVVTVQFISPSNGMITRPEWTLSQNLSLECTSSLPYFDGNVRNRT